MEWPAITAFHRSTDSSVRHPLEIAFVLVLSWNNTLGGISLIASTTMPFKTREVHVLRRDALLGREEIYM